MKPEKREKRMKTNADWLDLSQKVKECKVKVGHKSGSSYTESHKKQKQETIRHKNTKYFFI